jgi:hypothetical protein
MTADERFDDLMSAWLEEEAAPARLPERVLDATFERTRTSRQQIRWRPGLERIHVTRSALVLGGTAVLVMAAALGLRFSADQPAVGGPVVTADPSPEPTTSPSEAEVTDLLNGFLEARVAGDGAQRYLGDPAEAVPLLYATTSGAPYERAEFEHVLGVEWPYESLAFRVRLFAGDTVVEQLLFMGPDRPLRLGYVDNGFATDFAPTTEDGKPLALPYEYFDGEVTLRVAHPWVMSGNGAYPFGRLIPVGPGVPPTTDGGERNDWDRLVLMADPALVGTGCQPGAGPANAEALAESIRSDPDLGATAPATVSAGGAEAVMLDVVIAAGATVTVCDDPGPLDYVGLLLPILDQDVGSSVHMNNGVVTGAATGERMRLYLFDLPEGSTVRILAVAIIAPESSFERAVEAAAPVVDSVEFPAR